MFTRTQLFFFAALFAAVFLPSCRESVTDPKEEIVPESAAWESVPFFVFSKKVTYASYADSNKLAIASDQGYFVLRKGKPDFEFGSITWPSNRNVDPVFTEKYAAFVTNAFDGFIIKGIVNSSNLQTFSLSRSAPTLFQNPLLETGGDRNFAAINNRNQMIVAARNRVPTESAYGLPNLYLIDLNPFPGSSDPAYLRDITVRKVELPLPYTDLTACATVGEDFLVSLSFAGGGPDLKYNGIYKIDPQGKARQVSSFENRSVQQFFTLRDKLYGFAGNNFYVSEDGGDTWRTPDLSVDNGGVRFANVGNRLVAFVLDVMYELDLDKVEVKELDNKGLEKNKITSVVPFGGKVYVTTLSGVFVKSTKDFWTFKDEKK